MSAPCDVELWEAKIRRFRNIASRADLRRFEAIEAQQMESGELLKCAPTIWPVIYLSFTIRPSHAHWTVRLPNGTCHSVAKDEWLKFLDYLIWDPSSSYKDPVRNRRSEAA